MVQGQEYVRRIKSSCILLETSNLTQVEEELSTWAVFQDKEEFAVALEGVVHLDHEWVPDLLQNIPLRHRVLNLISPHDISLLKGLDSIQLICVLLLDKHYLAVGALTNYANHFKISPRNTTSLHTLVFVHNLLILRFSHVLIKFGFF